MESFYSIIYIKSNALTDECFSIGLLSGGGEGPFLFLSEKRLRLFGDLIHRHSFLSIRKTIRGLKAKIDKHRESQAGLLLFDPHFAKEKLDEICAKSNGTVLYSSPTTLNDWLTHELHQKLVLEFLGEKSSVPQNRHGFQLQWRAWCKQQEKEGGRRNVPLEDILKQSVDFPFLVDVWIPKSKSILKGINFDVKEKSRERHLFQLSVLLSVSRKYKIICYYPAPRTKEGKAALALAQESYPKVEFKVLFELIP